MTAILNFIHNTMSQSISGHTTMSGVPENPCRKLHFVFDLAQMAAILDFAAIF